MHSQQSTISRNHWPIAVTYFVSTTSHIFMCPLTSSSVSLWCLSSKFLKQLFPNEMSHIPFVAWSPCQKKGKENCCERKWCRLLKRWESLAGKCNHLFIRFLLWGSPTFSMHLAGAREAGKVCSEQRPSLLLLCVWQGFPSHDSLAHIPTPWSQGSSKHKCAVFSQER